MAFSLATMCNINHAFSQDASPKNSTQNKLSVRSEKKAAPGTYQFIVKTQKNQIAFTDDILFEIEKARDEKEIKYLELGAYIRIKILPRIIINTPGFKPFDQEFIYIQ